jgi:hypothetical protein
MKSDSKFQVVQKAAWAQKVELFWDMMPMWLGM